MTDSSALLALIEKLEAARKGSRELDALIKYEIIGPCGCGALCSPYYTTSIDDAMDLVPEGFSVTLSIGGADLARNALAALSPVGEEGGSFAKGTNSYPFPRPPALALAIAALKARAQ